LNQGLRGKAIAFLVFMALWLDGSFYPLILLPLLFVLLFERESLGKIGLGGSGLRRSLLLGTVVGSAVSAIYYPVFVHYLPGRMWEGLGLFALLTDLVWYPLYEEVAYRGFFLGSFADLVKGSQGVISSSTSSKRSSSSWCIRTISGPVCGCCSSRSSRWGSAWA